MTKEQKQLIIIGFLLIIFLAVLIGSLASAGKKKKPPDAVIPAAEAPVAEPSAASPKGTAQQAEGVSSEEKKTSAQGKWGRDPFGETSTHEAPVLDFKLRGITYAKGIGFAFINNDIVKKGDRMGDYVVAEIYKDKVLLKKGEQELYLSFPEE